MPIFLLVRQNEKDLKAMFLGHHIFILDYIEPDIFQNGDHEKVLRSAVGKTHVLRLELVMSYTTSHFPLIVLGYP